MARNGRRRRTEWPTVLLIGACYSAWAAAGIWLWPHFPFAALCVMAAAVTLQSSLMHEALHGHPTGNSGVNEALVSFPIGLVYPYRRFKSLHLRHHADEKLTDPFEDPESYYLAGRDYRELGPFVRRLLGANNTLAGRIVVGPIIATAAFAGAEASLLAAGDRHAWRAWVPHAAGVAAVLAAVTWGFGIPAWIYVAGPVWGGQAILAVRTFAEHRWDRDVAGRTVIVESSPLALLFLNNNLHLVHHRHPTVAWYRLPALFREKRRDWLEMNGGYFYSGYACLAASYAFRAKEPVEHPAIGKASAAEGGR